ncbi:MAG: hypothetical protein HY707_10745 [Ignavibacteriae bacterium]|nr:hypothetical protein [Ignavibacteriota bacterium]
MRPLDTSPEAERVQIEIFRAMSLEQRLHISFELNQTCQNLASVGVRLRHPDYDDEKIRLAVIRMEIGDELFLKAYPHARDVLP